MAAKTSAIGTYKAAVTRRSHRLSDRAPQDIWQSRYHARIVRDDTALQRFRSYIEYNSLRWEQDALREGSGGSP
ncbi:MAG: hypothetical protein H7Z42_22050 [Roseiflexaceae bacterium]|nr:hypothetical protein [Roseiflexaceae bacterium]